MVTKLDSAIILRFGDNGFVAELRFQDRSKDKNLSSTDHEKLLDEVTEYILKVTS